MGMKVGVFFGGKSVEHEVSVISALQAAHSFDRTKYDVIPVYMTKDGYMYVGDRVGKIEEYRDIPSLLKNSLRVTGVMDNGRFLLVRYPMRRFGSSVYSAIDVAFPVVHGTNVEDGALQGYFKTMSVPFAGSDVTASALGMDKYAAKAVLKDCGIPVLNCKRVLMKPFFKNTKAVIREIEGEFPYPAVVKPLNLGSSIGVQKVSGATELEDALELAFQYAGVAVVERAVQNLREINCAVLGDADSAVASECEEPISAHSVLDYSDKYISGGKGMSAAKRKFPADISPETRDKVRDLALKAFHALGCCGVARVDFLTDALSGDIWVNEVNTIPGSLSFYLWGPTKLSSGLSYTQLLDRLVELALKRERENSSLSYSLDINLLAGFAPGGLKNGIKK
ncbi:MAG: D-alanine--D-alanine ligase [Synergistaceae bacterium]|nr:D-alanine--D-alanine ligase [Synergistaceae bacterium]